MSEEDVEVLRRLFDRWERGDDFFTPELFDDRVESVRIGLDAITGIGGCRTGIDEMRAASLEWTEAWEDNRVHAERFIEIGNRVLVLSRRTARGRHSGMPLDQALADIFTLRDGKIVRWEVYWDRAEGMRAAGLEA